MAEDNGNIFVWLSLRADGDILRSGRERGMQNLRTGAAALQMSVRRHLSEALSRTAFLIVLSFCASRASAANVTVNANQVVTNTIAGVPTPATVANIGVGTNTSVYYNHMDASFISPTMDAIGASIVRYPGGSYSDIYHWTNHTATGGYAASTSNFGTFAKNILNAPNGLAKQAMITVDYGDSLNNTMGGQPEEAAAWVAYCNATVDGPNATMQLGTDDEGNNWGTVRYWAALRAANSSDRSWTTDGSAGVVLDSSDLPSISPGNFLKLQRAAPLDVQYWEIGNEQNGNGYFSGLNWENDKHSLKTGAARVGDPNLSPTFYGQQVVNFAAQMKAVDPTIKIGAVLDNASNYDRFVLQATAQNPVTLQNQTAAQAMDFGIVHYYPNYNSGTDSTATNFLAARVGDVPNTVNSERNNYVTPYAGVDASHIPLFFTEFGNLGSTLPAATAGLQTAIDYAGFLKAGAMNADQWEFMNGGIANDATTFSPTAGGSYYAMEALHAFIRPGDTFVSSSSSQNSTGIIYSAIRPDGKLALMLINPNTAAQNIPVTVNGNQYSSTGTQYATSLAADPTQSTVNNLGNSFTASVLGRSILVLILSPAAVPGDYNNDGVVDAADYTVWRDTLGQSGSGLAADGTGPGGTPDGIVDGLDYQFWSDHFGATTPGSGSGSGATVPEPSTCLLALIAAATLQLRWARSQAIEP
jgi:hypothetical protein